MGFHRNPSIENDPVGQAKDLVYRLGAWKSLRTYVMD